MIRKKQALLTKKKIFNNAIFLFKKRGYDNVTVKEICDQSNIAKGTFYVHYKSKEDIIKESYYSDMEEFVIYKYEEFIKDMNDLNTKDKIKKFLISELMFSEFSGFEMTCRAFVYNLSNCLNEKSLHFEKRNFTKILKDLINKGIENKEFKTNENKDFIFNYLESFIRGFMGTWCFSNGNFDIIKEGEKHINLLIKNL